MAHEHNEHKSQRRRIEIQVDPAPPAALSHDDEPAPGGDLAASPAPGPVSPVDASLEDRLARAEDGWKRAAADLDNLRKRMRREMESNRIAERETILRAWLEVIDSLERALASAGAASNPWREGMEAIHQQMLETLRRFGVTPFRALGEPFDPQRHEAVATARLPGEPEGRIVDVAQTGYLIDGAILRPAKVIPVKHQ